LIPILTVFALLVCASMLAGYLPVRMLAASWPRTSRLALQSLLGAGTIALTLGWVHYFSALGTRLALLGLMPVAAGAATLAYDLSKRRSRRHRNYVWLALSLAAAVVALAPFFVLGSATSFGLYSNDAFWWAAADWRVENYTFDVPDEQVTSPLARIAVKLKRYGFNYLSLMVQSITGLRSWQVVHLNGAFGLFLVVQAAWLLARRMHVWWRMALLVALAAAVNHFTYRVFLDAVLAFQFGFAYFLAIIAMIAGPVPRREVNRYGLILGILASSLGVFYADLIPVTGLAAAAVMIGMRLLRLLTGRHASIVAIAAGVFLVTMLPLVLALPRYVQHVATYKLTGDHYKFADVFHTWMHLTGAMDLYHYMHGLPDNPLQYAGAAAVTALAVHAVRSYRKLWRPLITFGPMLVVFSGLWAYLAFNVQQYTAHRMMVITSPIIVTLLLASIRPVQRLKKQKLPGRRSKQPKAPPRWKQLVARPWPVIAVLAFAANLYPAYRMLAFAKTNYIVVTPLEREIGDEWIPKLPPGSKVTLDVEEDLFLFYAHYMYAETLHGLRGDESRLIFPRTLYMFVTGSPVEEFKPGETEYVLRRKGIGRILGSFRPVAQNERYELLEPVDRSALGLVWFRHGFYQLEREGGTQWRWLADAGSVTAVTAKPQTLELISLMEHNPAIGSTNLHIAMNGAVVHRVTLPPTQVVRVKLPLKTGSNEIVFDSTTPPALFGGDLRPISLRLINPQLRLIPPL
jgi:hypothetical protein